MTTNTEGAPDPHTGRFAVWIAGGLGIAAIVAYGSYQAQQRLAARERAPAAAEARASAPAAPSQLLDRTAAASAALDVEALAQLDRELETAAARTTRPEHASALRVARASALSVRALEASIRSHRSGTAAAKAELDSTLSGGRALADTLTREGIAPAAVARVEARLDLAEGRDITMLHPVVLMADYPDTELRLAALSRPLFTGGELTDAELTDLTTTLRASSPQSGLTRLLLAMALEASGDTTAADSETRAVLSATPGQPLAVAMQTPPVADAEPRGAAVAPPEPAPEPKPEPEPTPEPKPAAPEPAQPKPAPSEPPKAKPTQPKPKPSNKPKPQAGNKPKPKPKRTKPDFDTLLADGCKLVRSGDAAEGFKILKEAHDIKPGGARVTLCMAQAQDKLGRSASALALVDRVIRKAPKNKTALLLAARLEAGQGNRSTAEDYYRRVLDLDPNNTKAKKFLGITD